MRDMKRLTGFALAVLVNALFVGAFLWPSTPPAPRGEVLITDVKTTA
jgi:hypothetical protein